MPREMALGLPGLLNEAFPVVLMPRPVLVWQEVWMASPLSAQDRLHIANTSRRAGLQGSRYGSTDILPIAHILFGKEAKVQGGVAEVFPPKCPGEEVKQCEKRSY